MIFMCYLNPTLPIGHAYVPKRTEHQFYIIISVSCMLVFQLGTDFWNSSCIHCFQSREFPILCGWNLVVAKWRLKKVMHHFLQSTYISALSLSKCVFTLVEGSKGSSLQKRGENVLDDFSCGDSTLPQFADSAPKLHAKFEEFESLKFKQKTSRELFPLENRKGIYPFFLIILRREHLLLMHT